MKVLVTGAGGFLGTEVVRRLWARQPDLLRCLVRSRTPQVLRDISAEDSRVQLVTGSLLSHRDIEGMLDGVETVYHLAFGMKGGVPEMFLNGVVTSKRLLDVIARTPSIRKIVLVSSFAVYGASDRPRGALIDESFPLEPHPELRDAYSYAKARAEALFRAFHELDGRPLVIVRPGVIYGPGGPAISTRVGIRFPGFFMHFGGRNLLPLTYVTNCAEAIAVAGEHDAEYDVVNIVDDDIPTCGQYLRQYRKRVKRLKCLRMPYPGALLLSHLMVRYNRYSKGQLPAVLTPYRAKAWWKGNRFTNAHLKELGWQQPVPTEAALQKTFEFLRRETSH